MTIMNNEDPADPSVHEPRELPEPAAWVHDVVAADNEPEQALSFAPDNFPLMGICGFRSVACRPLYTADQMREAVAAERERHAQAMRDAARYRFVRTADKVAISAEAARDPVAYDAAIDAAIAAEKEQPK